MTRRLILAMLAAMVIMPLSAVAHEGHDHRVLGTVTMAAADHVMLKDTDNRDVTVHLNSDTKALRDKKPARVEDIGAGIRVVITAAIVKKNNVEMMVAKVIELGTAPSPR
jgi:hypothetical protein